MRQFKKVTIKLVDFDKYGRQVCKVYYKGKDLSLLLVQKGYAQIYWKYFDGNESFLKRSSFTAQNKCKKLNYEKYRRN